MVQHPLAHDTPAPANASTQPPPQPEQAQVPAGGATVADDAAEDGGGHQAATTAPAPLPEGVVVRDGKWWTKVQPMAEVHRLELHVPAPALVQLWSQPDFVEEVCQPCPW